MQYFYRIVLSLIDRGKSHILSSESGKNRTYFDISPIYRKTIYSNLEEMLSSIIMFTVTVIT